jgi:hypothetical protein
VWPSSFLFLLFGLVGLSSALNAVASSSDTYYGSETRRYGVTVLTETHFGLCWPQYFLSLVTGASKNVKGLRPKIELLSCSFAFSLLVV